MWAVVVYLKSHPGFDLIGPFPNESRASQYVKACQGPDGYDPDDIEQIIVWPFIIPHCLDVAVKIKF